MKILYITTIGSTMRFFRSFVKELMDEGHTVDIAANIDIDEVTPCFSEWGCKIFKLACSRSPLRAGNIKAIKQIQKLVEEGGYDIVHCHTPIAAACTRVACRNARKRGVKVIYTAHGFHFYKGAPKLNWLLFFPIEWICSFWTDTLVTINREDYARAKKWMHAGEIRYVPGVGIRTVEFTDACVDRDAKREELGIPKDAYVVLSVGELNENKNHQCVIRAISMIEEKNIHYVIAGAGDQTNLNTVSKQYAMEDRTHLLGLRSDIPELYKMADVFVLPSYREGLNVSTMEALAAGMPCIVSNIRGNTDMVSQTEGALCDPHSVYDFADAIRSIMHENKHYSKNNIEKSKMFDYRAINDEMKEIYHVQL